jgi:hypothetical protein
MSDKTISYYDVVQEILKRVNDANGDVYLDRAKELVYEGISSLASTALQDDIFGILKSELVEVATLSNSWKIKIKGSGRELDKNPANIISVIDDITNPEEIAVDGIIDHKYIKMSLAEINQLNDSENAPFNDEIFYYQRENYIYFHPKDRMVAQKLVITYIADPDEYSYGVFDDGTGSSSLERDFSLNFLYKIIDYGVGRIREQQGGE